MSAREQILGKLREALRETQRQALGSELQNKKTTAATQPVELPDVARYYAEHAGYSHLHLVENKAERIACFCNSLTAAHAQVITVQANNMSSRYWARVLVEECRSRSIKRILLGNEWLQQMPDVLNTASDIEKFFYNNAIEDCKQEMFMNMAAACTTAKAAIAETGTLILWPDAHAPRLMSLVPPIHFVLLDAAKIHATFYHAMRDEGWGVGDNCLPTNALLISGPSKTADIQQTLAYGAHGPKELIVLLQLANE